MFDYQEGSIFDPDAFAPKPKKKQPFENTHQRVDWKPIAKSAKQVKQNAFGLIHEFQKIHSPQYQLSKANRQIKEVEAKEKLMEVRARLRQKQEEYKRRNPSLLHKLKDKLEENKSPYQGLWKKDRVSVPKYREE